MPGSGRAAVQRHARAKLLALDLGHAEVAVPLRANVRQHHGIAHGGLIAFLVDALDVLTIHHWGDAARGLGELRRVTAGPIVILTFEPEVASSWWLPDDYAPELKSLTVRDAPDLQVLRRELGQIEVQVLPVPARCRDGFLMSFWDRPELVLEPEARAATPGFATLSEDVQARICATLSGFDSGLRLVLARG